MFRSYFFGIIFVIGAFVSVAEANNMQPIYRYILTETGKFSSLDPLDADASSNLPVARMIYATPLETSNRNELASRVLESFRYDSASRTIEWIVKEGLKFDDGSPLSADDVAFAVSRMAFTRPKFPVLANIEGVEKWSKGKNALSSFPPGISVDGRKVSIRLVEDSEHPLFRFCLELFSIVPRRCVDASTNKIACERIPTSGPYTIAEQTKTSVEFVRRAGESTEAIPGKIRFEYIAPNDVEKHIHGFDERTIVAGSEADYSGNQLANLQAKIRFQFMPASRFEALIINKNVPPFNDQKCRQMFARSFRAQIKLMEKDRTIESSLFTKILPGYETASALESAVPLSEGDASACKTKFGKHDITWAIDEADMDTVFHRALVSTFEEVGAQITKPKVVKTRRELVETFASDRAAFYNTGSGFWALDPAGDLKMLFTPNLHRQIGQVTSDQKLQALLSDVERRTDSFRQINEHIFSQSLLNVYGHQRRFFASKNSSLMPEAAFAITSPAPYQTFQVKK